MTSQKGSTASTRMKPVLDPTKRIARDRPVDKEGFDSCCLRMLRVSGRPSWPGTRMVCTVCERQAVVQEDGGWARGR